MIQSWKQPLFYLIESFWGTGFRLASRVQALTKPGITQSVIASGGKRVVIVAPHPDDETIGAGGTAMLHRRANDSVTAVIVTDGRGSRATGFSAEEIIKQRHREMTRAAGILGIAFVWLGFPEGGWEEQAARETLKPLLQGADIIYTPSCVDFHPEHLRVARLVAELVAPQQRIRIVELGVPLTAILVNRLADIREVAARKELALAAFTSQQGVISPLKRLARYRKWFYGTAALEVFWELPGEVYARVMARGDWQHGGHCPFRGIRPRPFSDPLASLLGRNIRRMLREIPQTISVSPASVKVDGNLPKTCAAGIKGNSTL